MENNKIIAEFMDYENVDEMFPFDGELHYHTSWDWLMPVIEKCYILNNEQGFSAFDDFCDLDIRLAYDNVVDFINEYNKTN